MADSTPPEGDEILRNTDKTATQHASTAGTPPREYAGVLAAERRRLVVDVLAEQTTAVELGELAAEIATVEAGADSPPEEPIRDVKIGLHHAHLPKLDEVGVLDYDPKSRVIKPADAVAGTDDTTSTIAHGCTTPIDELRGCVLEYFDESTGATASLDDLSRYAAARLADSHDWSAERIQLWFHHAVLPKLDDVGVIDYGFQTTTIRYHEDSS